MKIVLMSDTHGLHEDVDVPDGDLVIHAGDWTGRGTKKQAARFAAWFCALPHQHKVVIAGNHDFIAEQDPAFVRNLFVNAHYLQDEGVQIDDINIWGSPWQPEFFNWAFNLPRGMPLRRKWRKIPSDTDILVTHGPARGRLDRTQDGVDTGCEDLLDEIEKRLYPHLKLHVCGHIHEARGSIDNLWMSVNASIWDHLGNRVMSPYVIDSEVFW